MDSILLSSTNLFKEIKVLTLNGCRSLMVEWRTVARGKIPRKEGRNSLKSARQSSCGGSICNFNKVASNGGLKPTAKIPPAALLFSLVKCNYSTIMLNYKPAGLKTGRRRTWKRQKTWELTVLRLRCRKALIAFTNKEVEALFGRSEGQGLLRELVKRKLAGREFLVNGRWGVVEGSRFRVDGLTPLLEEVGSTWRYLRQKSIQPAEKPTEILMDLFNARQQSKPLQFFSPWGPRYKNKNSSIGSEDPEMRTLQELREIFGALSGEGFQVRFLLMPADIYGTEINSLSQAFVKDYFQSLEERAREKLSATSKVIVQPWSELRERDWWRYESLQQAVTENFSGFVSTAEYNSALKTARAFNPENSEESARAYCIERVVEGRIIEKLYSPIKLSLVRKEKDMLDGPLKRLYIINEKNRAPWLAGGR